MRESCFSWVISAVKSEMSANPRRSVSSPSRAGFRAASGEWMFLLNSDAINSYNATFSGSFVNGVFVPAVDNPATPTVNEGNHWGEPTGLVSSRFARLSIQFNF